MTHPNPPGQYPSYPQQQPGQPYGQVPQQPYPGQPYPGQPYPGQPYPGQQYPGAGYGHPGQDPYAMQRPPLAGWGSRVGASLLDGLIGGLIPMVLFVVGLVMMVSAAKDTTCDSYSSSSAYQRTCTVDSVDTGAMTTGVIMFLIGAVAALVIGLVMLYKQGKTGQTWGKKIVGIAVLRERDGMPTGFGMAFVRNLCHIADGFFYLGYLWPLWDEKKQTFADKIVSTVVVRTK
ncbi:RDD family protein [Streptomyces olivoreticuli]